MAEEPMDPFNAALGTLLGDSNKQSGKTTSKGVSKFDQSVIPAFMKQLAQYQQAQKRVGGDIAQRNQERAAEAERRNQQQLEAIRGIYGQSRDDAAQSYQGALGRTQQGLVGRGLANTTLLPSMQALNQREYGNQLNRIASQEAGMFANTLGQQAQRMDQIGANRNQMLAGIDTRGLDIQSLLAQAMAGDRVQSSKSKNVQKTKGGLFGLF